MKLEHREHKFLPIASAGSIKAEDLPNVVIQIDDDQTYDLGCLCYQFRESITETLSGTPSRVDIRSFDAKRLSAVGDIAVWLQKMVNRSMPVNSLVLTTKAFTEVMDWCDRNGYQNALMEKIVAKKALEVYFEHCFGRLASKEISLSCARRAQLGALKLFQVCFRDEKFCKHMKAVWFGSRKESSVEITPSGVFVSESKIALSARKLHDLRNLGWSERTYIRIRPDEVNALSDEDIPSVLLVLPDKSTLDVGAFCFRRRLKRLRTVDRLALMVKESSLDTQRMIPIKRLLSCLCNALQWEGIRHTTVMGRFRHYSKFFEFCDENGFEGALYDTRVANIALEAYVQFVSDEWRRNRIVSSYGHDLQYDARAVMQAVHSDDEFGNSLKIIQTSSQSANITTVPDEEDQGKVLALCQTIFDGFFELSCGFAPYPYRLELPRYLPWPRHHIWIFAKKNWHNKFALPSYRESNHIGHVAYDYATGRIVSAEEAELLCNPGNGIERVREAENKQCSANLNRRDPVRLRAASVAHNVFFILFLSNANMNFNDARELSWSKDHDFQTENQNFRSVKWRAKGRNCKFEIDSVFLPVFKKFLRVREFMLNGSECDTLFISLGKSRNESPHGVAPGFLSATYKTLLQIDPELKKVMSRQMRVKKSDVALAISDVPTTAAVLQNSEATVIRRYTGGSETMHVQQMTSYFEAFSEGARIIVGRDETVVGIPSGNCRNIGDVGLLNESAPIKVNCENAEGCLFCKSFRLHADREDARKILSCIQYVQFVSVSAKDIEEIDSVHEKIIGRAEELLQIIEQHAPGTVGAVREDVDEGNLTAYWQAKVEMLQDVGVL